MHRLSILLLAFLTSYCHGDAPSPEPNATGSSDKQTKAACKNDDKKCQASKKTSSEQSGEEKSDSSLESLLKQLQSKGGDSGAADDLLGGLSGAVKRDAAPSDTISLIDRFDPYTSFYLNKPEEKLLPEIATEVERPYHCPGDSFLVGMGGEYDFGHKDRIFKASCGFFQTADKRPTKKSTCSITAEFQNTAGVNTDLFACSEQGTFLAGIYSEYDAARKDRIFKYECCKMTTWDNNPIQVSQQPNLAGEIADVCSPRVPYKSYEASYSQQPEQTPTTAIGVFLGYLGLQNGNFMRSWVNEYNNDLQDGVPSAIDQRGERAPLDFMCFPGSIMTKVGSDYFSDYSDRRYNFRCCQLEVKK